MADKELKIKNKSDRDHPVLSEDSPLNRHLLRATGLPDVKSLLVALAHPMSKEDLEAVGRKAGNHKAHHNRLKHLREHAIKMHGEIGVEPEADEDDEETSKRYPQRRRPLNPAGHPLDDEDAGLSEFEYLNKAFPVEPYVPLNKAVLSETLGVTQKDPNKPRPGIHFAPQETGSVRPPVSNEPGGTRITSSHRSYDPEAGRTVLEHHHINGAGYLDLGPGPEPFRSKINFNMQDPHEAAVHSALKQLGHQNPENIGNHILYQDYMPDPHNPLKAQGNDNTERKAMARNISRVHGGISPEQAHAVLDRFHGQALEQFQAHSMHSMDDVKVPRIVREESPGIDRRTGEPIPGKEKRELVDAVKRDKAGNPIVKPGTRPLEVKHVARLIRLWNSIPTDQREATRKWYNTEAHEYIKDLSRAANVPYLKAAGVLALFNNGMGWETGASGAAQALFGDTLGITSKMTGKPMDISTHTYGPVREKINDILNAPNDDHDEIRRRINKHLSSNKLGNFFMDMINAAPYHTNTNDRHQLAIMGHVHEPGTFKTEDEKGPDGKVRKVRKEVSGAYQITAKDKEHRYFWRTMHAAAHQLGVDPRELQAATWVHWRRGKQSGTDKGENFEGWKVARAFVDQKMLENAHQKGPVEERKVQGIIDERKKREAETKKVMPPLTEKQQGKAAGRKTQGRTILRRQQQAWRASGLYPGYEKERLKQEAAAANKSFSEEQWEIDYYNEQLRKSYEQEERCQELPQLYLLRRH